MLRFLLGIIVGAVGALVIERTQRNGMLEKRLADMQDRATTALAESRRLLEETRHELSAALEAGRRNLETRTERFRRAQQEATTEGEQTEGEQPGQTAE